MIEFLASHPQNEKGTEMEQYGNGQSKGSSDNDQSDNSENGGAPTGWSSQSSFLNH